MSDGSVGALAREFAMVSLLAFGGVNAVVPEIHRQVVDIAGWATGQQFAEMFAIAQAAPGPNLLLATLIGWHVAGLAGALVATAAICGPSCVLTYLVLRVWDRFRHMAWRTVVQRGLAPVTIGLVAASAFLIARGTIDGWVPLTIAAVTAVFAMVTPYNPLWMFAAGAGLGLLGLV